MNTPPEYLETEIKQIIKIDPKGKYVLVIDQPISMELKQRLVDQIQKWWRSDDPVLVVYGRVRLEKVK